MKEIRNCRVFEKGNKVIEIGENIFFCFPVFVLISDYRPIMAWFVDSNKFYPVKKATKLDRISF